MLYIMTGVGSFLGKWHNKISLLIYDLQSEDWINTYYMLKGFLKAHRIRTWAVMCPMLMWITP